MKIQDLDEFLRDYKRTLKSESDYLNLYELLDSEKENMIDEIRELFVRGEIKNNNTKILLYRKRNKCFYEDTDLLKAFCEEELKNKLSRLDEYTCNKKLLLKDLFCVLDGIITTSEFLWEEKYTKSKELSNYILNFAKSDYKNIDIEEVEKRIQQHKIELSNYIYEELYSAYETDGTVCLGYEDYVRICDLILDLNENNELAKSFKEFCVENLKYYEE